MKFRSFAGVFILSIITVLFSCNQEYTPKPKGYFRIDLPEHSYVNWDGGFCPFTLEIPTYSVMKPYRDSVAEPCWKYLLIPKFNAEIFLSYKSVNGDLESFVEDTRTLVYKHAVKADAIDETFIEVKGERVYGIIYDIAGNAASSLQFFVTDSTKHFLRGALYFNSPPQSDSLAPLVSFIREDVIEMVTTTRWK